MIFELFDVTDRKYEEISPPEVEEFCKITDHTYTKAEVVCLSLNPTSYLNIVKIFEL